MDVEFSKIKIIYFLYSAAAYLQGLPFGGVNNLCGAIAHADKKIFFD